MHFGGVVGRRQGRGPRGEARRAPRLRVAAAFFRRDALGLNGTDALVAMSEFSGSAHEDTRYSCSPNNLAFGDEAKAKEVVRHFVQRQVAQRLKRIWITVSP